tara:strand:- start:53 stop:322 length:270 start_codon:yes stop_codon:yes gene_type:complete
MVATETKNNSRSTFLIDGCGVGIDGCDTMYNLHLWFKGVSVWMDVDELYEFMEEMTNEENQKKMKNEMELIRLVKNTEKRVAELKGSRS